MARIAPGAVQSAVAAVLATEEGKTATTHLYVHLPVPDLPRATITTDSQAVHVDQAGAIAGPEGNAWSEFLLAVHYRLHIPGLIGLILVGILGVMIVALSLSGVIAPQFGRASCREHECQYV